MDTITVSIADWFDREPVVHRSLWLVGRGHDCPGLPGSFPAPAAEHPRHPAGGADDLRVGDLQAGTANVIAYNNGHGVVVVGADSIGNKIRGNSIHSNDRLGIDLGGDVVTANDTDDTDTGPNQRLNFPVLRAVRANTWQTPTTRVTGQYEGAANATLTLDFYANGEADASGYGEGQRYLDSITITTNSQGRATFNAELQAETAAGELVTATATDARGNTSNFAGPLSPLARGVSSPAAGPAMTRSSWSRIQTAIPIR